MRNPTEGRSPNVSRIAIAILAVAGIALAGCGGAATASPSPIPAPSATQAAFDSCLIGSWTVLGQTQNSPADDETITYTGGEGEIFTIDASGALTIDTHAAQKIVFVSAGESFSATVSGTGKGTLTTGITGGKKILYFTPSADDTRKTLSLDSTGTELGPARPDTQFSAVYTCAPGRFTFYKTAVNYMVDGPIVELKSGGGSSSSPAASAKPS